jgi:CheY-like chemotaxis protein
MPGGRVLIVDDNPFNVKLAKYLLTSDGFDVRVAENSDEALATIAAWAPELVLMDLWLPGTDGLALTRIVRADPSNRRIVIIAFSAQTSAAEQQRALDAGCDGYLSKPIDTRSFAAAVRRHLEASSALSDNTRPDS